MELYLLRHGHAEAQSHSGGDAGRTLTAEGRSEVRHAAVRMKKMGANPAIIVASPYRRAGETAEIVAGVLGYRGEILTSAALTPDSPPREAWDDLRIHSDAPAVLAVAHEPLLSNLLAWLVVSPQSAAPFPTAGLECVEVDPSKIAPAGTIRVIR